MYVKSPNETKTTVHLKAMQVHTGLMTLHFSYAHTYMNRAYEKVFVERL